MNTHVIAFLSSALKNTSQALTAILVIFGAAYAFAEPAVRQYVENTLAAPLKDLSDRQELAIAKQEAYQEKQTETTNDIASRQKVIRETQRIKSILDAELRADVKKLLRLYQRNPE